MTVHRERHHKIFLWCRFLLIEKIVLEIFPNVKINKNYKMN